MEGEYKIERIGNDCYQIGEGPHWDDSQQCLYFVDITECIVGRYDPTSKTIFKAKVGGAKSVGFIIPVKNCSDKFIIAFDNKITLIQWDGKSSTVNVLKDLAVANEPENGRINDGKVDFQGRLVTGTMLIDWASSLETHKGVLVTYAPWEQSKLSTRLTGVGLSNGLAWNEKTGKMYYADSLKYNVTEYNYDEKTGSIGDGKIVFDSKSPAYGLPAGSLPDGITIDSEGHLWIALFFGSRVVQIDVNSGKILKTVMIPTSQVTSVSFGDKNLDALYVTTCSLGPHNKLLDSPAGALYKVTGLKANGISANAFRLDNCV